jgi:hypothetical protein
MAINWIIISPIDINLNMYGIPETNNKIIIIKTIVINCLNIYDMETDLNVEPILYTDINAGIPPFKKFNIGETINITKIDAVFAQGGRDGIISSLININTNKFLTITQLKKNNNMEQNIATISSINSYTS